MIGLHVDVRGVATIQAVFRHAGQAAPKVIALALNHTGDKTKTQVKRALAKQTGAKVGVVDKALSSRKANVGSLVYEIRAKGPYMSLKEFSPRQGAAGTVASPWGKRQVFAGAFMGPRPGAIARRLGGHVFTRDGSGRLPIKKLFGPAIPVEMMRDTVPAAFEQTVSRELPPRLAHEMARLLG